MKIIKKKGIDKIRVTHNKKLFYWIIILIIILIILIGIIILDKKKFITEDKRECNLDSDCMPACSCHPDSCINSIERGNCERLICSQECIGPLDCDIGSCQCIDKKCAVVKK